MANRLEQFVQDHRQEFDSEEPGIQVWSQIRSELDGAQVVSINRYSWVWKAAAIFLFGLSGYLLVERNMDSGNNAIAEVGNIPEFSLTEIEVHYTSIIDQKKMEILKLGADHPSLIQNFQNDVGSLDSLYLELQAEFRDTSNERVLDAMINNLKLRINILNYQMSIIEKIRSKEIDKNEEDDDTYNI